MINVGRTHLVSGFGSLSTDDFGSLKSCMLGTALWVRMFREEFQAMGSQPLAGLGVECGACFLYLSWSPTSCECFWTLLEILSLLGLSSLAQPGHHFFLWISLESPWQTFLTCLLFSARKHKRKRRNNFFLMAGDPSQPGISAPWMDFPLGLQRPWADGTISMNFGFDIVCQKFDVNNRIVIFRLKWLNQKEELFRYLPLDSRLKCSLWSSKFWISTTPGKGICRSLKQRWITSGERSHDERNGLIDGVIDRPLKLLQIFWSRCSSSCFFNYPFLMCEEWTYLWSWAPKS